MTAAARVGARVVVVEHEGRPALRLVRDDGVETVVFDDAVEAATIGARLFTVSRKIQGGAK